MAHTLIVTSDPNTQVITTFPSSKKQLYESQKQRVNIAWFGIICMLMGTILGIVTIIACDAIAGTNTSETVRSLLVEHSP